MRIVVISHVTLDGVMQAPGRPDEDTRGGFSHGGWAIPGNDEAMLQAIGERMAEPGGGLHRDLPAGLGAAHPTRSALATCDGIVCHHDQQSLCDTPLTCARAGSLLGLGNRDNGCGRSTKASVGSDQDGVKR